MVFKDLPLNTGNVDSILNNTLNAATDTGSRYATAFYILLKYIGLLIFPHPLSYDYSFSQIKVQKAKNLVEAFYIIHNFGMNGMSCIQQCADKREEQVLIFEEFAKHQE